MSNRTTERNIVYLRDGPAVVLIGRFQRGTDRATLSR